MSQVHLTAVWRPLAVWTGVSVAATATAAGVPGAWRDARAGEDVAALLVAVCASALAASLAWLWVVTTTTVAGLVGGHPRRWRAGATRRIVLVACGAAVVAAPSVPALAAGGDGAELLAGLALPDRAVEPGHRARHRPPAAPRPPDIHVVRTGDSLWTIARAHPVPGATVDERWRAIWHANRGVVGPDPDLILPGQALRLPTPPLPPTPPTPSTDGDR